MKDVYFGKNVSLKKSNFEIISGYMNKTRRNFSQTLNRIIEEWDEFSIALMKYKAEQEAKEQLSDIKQAKVIKE